ncbi:MAG: CPBP family intramembrane metalloprotease [Nocardiopsaceae bacterium]|nr:CPBP family intramembrane metalloprotease [Nocardiopsaceae bacterium]
MTKAYGQLLRWGLVGLTIVLVAVLAGLPPQVIFWGEGLLAGGVFFPTAIGLVLLWAFSSRDQRGDLDKRVGLTLGGHPVHIELAWLMTALLCFLGGTIGLSRLFAMVLPPALFVTAMPVVRFVFLFAMPILFTDRAGRTLRRHGAGMQNLAMNVTERWRWMGAVPVLCCLGLTAASAYPVDEPLPDAPSPAALIATVLVAFIAIAVPEEVFFRAMLQTRLEQVAGRWPAILLTSCVFAFTYAVLNDYVELTPLPPQFSENLPAALETYGVFGLLLGYMWVCYRNIWLNIVLRGSLITLLVAPTVRLVT